MSFSGDVKKEIAEHKINKPCCIVAACYAIACFGKYFDDKGVILHTEKAFVAKFAKSMYERIGISGKIFVKGTENMPIYEFAIKQAEDVTQLLQTFGHTGKETALHINEDIFKCDNCYSSFFAAAFLCTGIVTNPKSDYNLEFTCNR
ncbi:MAG: DNA-binding protein WhiA, partial [Oscillospiraceae bacterium]